VVNARHRVESVERDDRYADLPADVLLVQAHPEALASCQEFLPVVADSETMADPSWGRALAVKA